MKNRYVKNLSLALCVLALAGCALRPSIYQWGGYDAMLYQSYKSPEKVLELRQGLAAHIGKMEQSQQKVAPGLYAELGTLYLQSGDSANALTMYTKERSAWPESKGLMDALIANIGKRAVAKTEGKS